jgi:murein DD-endopeptidase MepM/ murein hydrolase activator NlpD
MRFLVLLGGFGFVSGSGVALASSPEAVHLDDLREAEEAVRSSADYLKPASASTHNPSPSAQVGLNPPDAPAPVPEFSPPRSSSSITLKSPSPAENQMQIPVPVSPPAAVVAEAPATAPSMVESLQQANQSPEPGGDANQVVSMPTAQDIAEEAAEALTQDAGSANQGNASGYGGGVFIDPTDYSVGATQAPTATPNVIFAERTTGCQITVPSGQTSPNSTCTTTAVKPAPAGTDNRGVQVGPVNVSSRGVTLGSTTVISREFLNEKLRPLNVLRRGNEEYVFPLSIPAPITSLFGWRMHPIHQSWRFHAGTDLAAPTGTPVLATRSGRVAVSDNLGGYGLTVILRHDEDNLESRYAHLSKVAVRPGEWVEQGEVIGLVGSTGTSTGPHLHFEIRQLTAQGWVAVDAQEVLEYGISNLLQIINNPLVALGQADEADSPEDVLPANYPFRPAQPNAS